uniref:TF-B3 domain-containing protein n=1 Tax=Kalanchoe fedtschenkoi TaxID=63787 RepID=A0A7N1A9N2_KALFE
MEMKDDTGVAEYEKSTDNLLHAAPLDAAGMEDNDVMLDLSCFGGGGYDSAAAAMEEADHQDLMDSAAAIFCDDLIPPLPDFQCMSSSSSSSSSVKPVAYQSTASSSVSSTSSSWAVLRSESEEHNVAAGGYTSHHDHSHGHHPQQVVREQSNGLDEDGDIGCMDVMETLSYIDLLDESGQVWGYKDSPVFYSSPVEAFQAENELQRPEPMAETHTEGLDKSEDLAMVFFEWLKSNKESISAEDLRSIKLKKSTIESAAKRLGNGKEGMKRLLQLILEWVQHHQLQRKPSREEGVAAAAAQPQFPNHPYPDTNLSNSNFQPDLSHTSPWSVGSSAGLDPMMAVGVPAPFGHLSNMADQQWPPLCMNYDNSTNAGQNLTPALHPFGAAAFNQYPCQYYPAVGNVSYLNGAVSEEVFVRTGSAATKEARKKRMARQRRFLPHHRHHHHHSSSGNGKAHGQHHGSNGLSNQMRMLTGAGQLGRVNMDESCANISHPPSGGYWAYLHNASPPQPPHLPVVPNSGNSIQGNEESPSYQRPIALDRRQGSKPEKNLRFLLQKVLKQSDVGSLGRIVLPKKEAETHLPQLTARDGINIAMEDIGTSNVWNMRYRFWPNNKSRMYLLENTGDFVRSNGLQEGDFIVIYSDIKCGKYMIRGVKVRQQGPKPDIRRSGKALKKNTWPTSNGSPFAPPSPKTPLA